MNLKFLGIGSAFCPHLRNTSAYIVGKDSLYLFDCGETVFEDVLKRGLLEKKNIYLIITHTHCDHVGSLGSLISYCYYVQNKKIIEVIYPGERVREFLNIVGINPKIYKYSHQLSQNEKNLKIKPVEVPHTEDMVSYGYKIYLNDEIEFFSGDCAKVPQEILNEFLNGKIERLYLDIVNEKTNHTAHGNIIDLQEIIPYDKRKNVYCMHLNKDYRGEMLEKGFGIIEIEEI